MGVIASLYFFVCCLSVLVVIYYAGYLQIRAPPAVTLETEETFFDAIANANMYYNLYKQYIMDSCCRIFTGCKFKGL